MTPTGKPILKRWPSNLMNGRIVTTDPADPAVARVLAQRIQL